MIKNTVNVYVANLGKYNEGELVGEWISLPVTEDEMNEMFVRIGVGEIVDGEYKHGKTEIENGMPYCYEEYAIHDYETELPIEISEYSNLEKLNELAEKMEELDEHDLNCINALLECGYIDKKNIVDGDIQDILDEHCFIEIDASMSNSDEALGYALAEINDIDSKLEELGLAGYFDYEKYGRDARFNGASIADNGIAIL